MFSIFLTQVLVWKFEIRVVHWNIQRWANSPFTRNLYFFLFLISDEIKDDINERGEREKGVMLLLENVLALSNKVDSNLLDKPEIPVKDQHTKFVVIIIKHWKWKLLLKPLETKVCVQSCFFNPVFYPQETGR